MFSGVADMLAALKSPPQNGPLYTQTYPWTPNAAPLVIAFESNQPIGALYLSKVDVPIAFSAEPVPPGGNPFYTATPPDDGNNPQTVPLPPGTIQVTLTATSSETYYVVATSGIARLLMEGSSNP